jgi:hypothetical protein
MTLARITAALAGAAIVAAIGLAAPAGAAHIALPTAPHSQQLDHTNVGSAQIFLDRYQVATAAAERMVRRTDSPGTSLAGSSASPDPVAIPVA